MVFLVLNQDAKHCVTTQSLINDKGSLGESRRCVDGLGVHLHFLLMRHSRECPIEAVQPLKASGRGGQERTVPARHGGEGVIELEVSGGEADDGDLQVAPGNLLLQQLLLLRVHLAAGDQDKVGASRVVVQHVLHGLFEDTTDAG